ncbi:MAG: recombinase family protein [Deltaproteobacteria bacterium]|nr:recombinase family protein [Deltaproteobacteria bacterium]NNK07025.1 recombinase family protein [Myxococcales bacterium]
MDEQLAGLRIGAYARFSSDKQSETSASAQVARLQQWVQTRGGQLSLEHTYRDEGISGATNQRPGLISLMAAVDSRELDVVVVEDLSRLSRDIEHSASIRKRFAFSGVRLIGIADGIDTLGNGGDLLYGVKSILSEQYLKDLGDKTSRGLRDRAQVGRVTGALPYGYASKPAPDGQGKVPFIVAAQAAVVQRIFGMRAAGHSYRDIAKTLNDEGVEPPRGRQKDSRKRRDGWAMSGVRSMLQNSKYAGRWTFGARSWKKSPTTGKRVVRPAESPVVEVALPELRIVGEETWSRVQAINEEARERHATVGPSAYAREGGASTARRVYPLSTLIRCGICGGPMVIEKTQKPRYRCDASRGNGGSCDNSRTVMEEALREAFTSCMLQYFKRPEVVAHLIETARAELATVQRTVPDERSEAETAFARTRGKIDNLVDLASTGAAPASILDKIRELEGLANRQERRVEELGAMLAPLDLPRPEDVVARIRDLGALFDKSPKDAREALKHLLDDGIQLHPLENGHYRARWTVRGGALFFAGTTKPPASTEGFEERTTLWVAGARFELTTFGL